MGGNFPVLRFAQRALCALALACAALWLVKSANAAGITMTNLEKMPCPGGEFLTNSKNGLFTVRCGYLVLSESADGTGRKIKIAIVVVLPKETTLWNAPPTVVLHGGPGVGIVNHWVSVATSPFAANGPLVIFDQRGVGQSTPHLCESLETYDSDADAMTIDQARAAMVKEMQTCIDELKKDKVDFNAYGTDVTVRDMEAIRTALGIETWNVYGVSYGTTVGLAYLAAHPERTRAVVLDSLYPPEMPGLSSGFTDFSRALDIMNAACGEQPRCRERFGDIGLSLDEAVKSLDEEPLKLPSGYTYLDGPRISGTTFMAVINSQMIAINTWYVLPLAIDEAKHRKSSDLIAGLYRDVLSESSIGVWFATECRERAPFDKIPTPPEKPRWPHLTKVSGVELFLSLCAMWPAKLEQNWESPRDVKVPTLLINGDWDPVTPPHFARETAKKLGRMAQLVVAPNTAHSSTSLDPCIASLAAAFLGDPTKALQVCEPRPQPVFATAIVAPDWTSAYIALAGMGVGTASWFVIIAFLGLASAFAWILDRIGRILRREKLEDPFWKRSSFWLASALVVLFVWWWSLITAWYGPDNVPYSYYYGVPIEVWFGSSLVLVAAAFAAYGTFQVFAEVQRRKVSAFWLLHRLWVVFGFAVTFFILSTAKLLPLSLDAIVRDLSYFAMMTGDAISSFMK